jgi:hypothetical protein
MAASASAVVITNRVRFMGIPLASVSSGRQRVAVRNVSAPRQPTEAEPKEHERNKTHQPREKSFLRLLNRPSQPRQKF